MRNKSHLLIILILALFIAGCSSQEKNRDDIISEFFDLNNSSEYTEIFNLTVMGSNYTYYNTSQGTIALIQDYKDYLIFLETMLESSGCTNRGVYSLGKITWRTGDAKTLITCHIPEGFNNIGKFKLFDLIFEEEERIIAFVVSNAFSELDRNFTIKVMNIKNNSLLFEFTLFVPKNIAIPLILDLSQKVDVSKGDWVRIVLFEEDNIHPISQNLVEIK
jgi:hypothetical protein